MRVLLFERFKNTENREGCHTKNDETEGLNVCRANLVGHALDVPRIQLLTEAIARDRQREPQATRRGRANMKQQCRGIAVLGVALIAVPVLGYAQTADIGKREYVNSCAVCYGDREGRWPNRSVSQDPTYRSHNNSEEQHGCVSFWSSSRGHCGPNSDRGSRAT